MDYKPSPFIKRIIDNDYQALSIKVTYNKNETVDFVFIDHSYDLDKGCESGFSRIELHRNDFKRLLKALNSLGIES